MHDEAQAAPGWSRTRRASAAIGIVLIGAAMLPIALSRSVTTLPVRTGTVDLNSASEHELQLLPNIGPAIAARIVLEREQHGPFTSVDDLARVPGVGERTVRRLRDHACVTP